MKQFKQLSRAIVALLAAFIMVGAAPAFAQHGADDTTSGSSGSGSGSTSTPAQPPTAAATETARQNAQKAKEAAKEAQAKAKEAKSEAQKAKIEAHDATESAKEAHDSKAELHQKGEGLLAEFRKLNGGKTKTPEERKAQCESHKAGLTTKFSNIGNNAQKVQDRISGVYTKAQAYQSANSLSPTGYDSLVATADSAKAASAASITALKAVTPTIDCNGTSVASDIATFKAAAQDTRDKLQAYKTSVRAILTALSTGGTN